MSAIVGSQSVQAASDAVLVPVTNAGTRVVGIDVWRAFAAVSIIWVHAGRSPEWEWLCSSGRWGTAFLSLIAGYFVALGLNKAVTTHKSVIGFTRDRAIRIGGAFVLWSALYILARLINYWAFGKISGYTTSPTALLFFGTMYHLWFLPYLLLVTCLAVPVIVFAVRTPARAMAVGVGLAIAAVVMCATVDVPNIPFSNDVTGFLTNAWVRCPPFMFGLAFGLWALHGRLVQPGWGTVAVCIVLVTVAATLLAATDLPRAILSRVAAISAFIASQGAWRGAVARWIGSMGALGFGVYLSHVLFVEGTTSVFRALGVPGGIPTDIAVFIIAVAVTFPAVALIRRVRALRWLIP